MSAHKLIDFDWSHTSMAARGRGRMANSFDMDGMSSSRVALLIATLIGSAIFCGVVTVVIGQLSNRPVFYLSLPLMMMLVIAVVIDPRRLLIGLVILRAILDPVFQRAILPGIGGLGGVVNFAIIGLALTLLAVERGKEMTRESWLPWIPFIVVIILGITWAPDRVFAIRSSLSLITYAAAYHGAFYAIRKPADLDRLVGWMLLSSIPVFVYAIVSFLLFGATYTLDAGESSSGRLSSPLAHPNILAFYTVVMLAAWLAKVKQDPLRPGLSGRTIGWWLYLVLLLGILAGTQTRSAWFGALLLFFVYGVTVNRAYLALLVVGACIAMAIPEVRERVLDLGSNNQVYTYSRLNSFAWRQYLWSSAIDAMSPFSFIVGNGVSAFWTFSPVFFPLAGGQNWNAHNVYVQLLYDVGAIGVIAFISIFVMAFAVLWKRKQIAREPRIVGLALVVCFAMMSYSDNMLDYLVVNWNCWFLIGLIVASDMHRSVPRKAKMAYSQ